MSANIPESIPTSADPRSRRPTKRARATNLTPTSAQAASLDALFANPGREIRDATFSSSSSGRPTNSGSRPPEIVTNVQGSSAGAGSGEFHVYKAARRREYERLREMDAEVHREKQNAEFEREKDSRDMKDDEKTRKNRERREKMKARKAKKGKGGNGPAGGGGSGGATANRQGITPARRPSVDQRRDGNGSDDEDDGANGNATVATSQHQGLVIHDDE